ncbi:MAG: hypothetical protein ACE5E5_03495 [Phycisphaerae bacterium]
MSARKWISPGCMLLGWMVFGAPAKVMPDSGGVPTRHADSAPARPEGTTWYYINIDRFCNGNPMNDPPGTAGWGDVGAAQNAGVHFGGDLAGLQSKLAHLVDLGIGGLIVGGMLTEDLQHVRKSVGPSDGATDPASALTAADRQLHDFVRAAHKKNMYVVVRVEQGANALDLLDGASKWLAPNGDESPPDGIDGWLVPISPRTAAPRLEKTARHIKAINPHAMLLGNALGSQDSPHAGMLDGIVDTRLADAMAWFVRDGAGESIAAMASALQPSDREGPTRRIYFSGPIDPMRPSQSNAPSMEESDAQARDRLRLAYGVLMLGAEHPGIHGGDEFGAALNRDSNATVPLPWPKPISHGKAGAYFPGELHELVKLLADLRRAHRPLRTGSFELLRLDQDRKLLIFSRRAGSEEAVAVLNFSGKKQRVTVSARWPRQRTVILSPQLRWGKRKNIPFVTGGSRQQADAWGDVNFWVDALAMRLVILDGPVDP